jgi:protease-4
MTLAADALVDRRRLKRRLTFWRVVAVLAIAAGVAAHLGKLPGLPDEAHVARLTVSGVILNDPDMLSVIAEAQRDDAVRALVLHIDSPGGTVAGGEQLHRALRRLAAQKPVVAVMQDVATSAGYMVAIAADHVLAQRSTVTGSIGVILHTTDVSGLLDKIGVTQEAVRSGPLKGVPSLFEPLTEQGRAATQAVVLDMYAMFVDMIVERRNLGRDQVLALADGRIYTGRQAHDAGLVDGIGGERAARRWLEAERGIADTMPIRDIDPADPTETLLGQLAVGAGKALLSERLSLDGLISVWQPQR